MGRSEPRGVAAGPALDPRELPGGGDESLKQTGMVQDACAGSGDLFVGMQSVPVIKTSRRVIIS